MKSLLKRKQSAFSKLTIHNLIIEVKFSPNLRVLLPVRKKQRKKERKG